MVVTKNMDKNENEIASNVPDESGFIDSARKPDDNPENPNLRELKLFDRNVKYEEDIIDGFMFQSFDTFEDLNSVVAQDLKKSEVNEKADSKLIQRESRRGITKASRLLIPSIVKSPGKQRLPMKTKDNFASLDGSSGATQHPTHKERLYLLPICTPKHQKRQDLEISNAGQILKSPVKKKLGKKKPRQICESHGSDCVSPDLRKAHSTLLGVSNRRRLSVHNTNSVESVSKPGTSSEPNLLIKSTTALGLNPETKSTTASETNQPIKVPKKRGRPFKVSSSNSAYQGTSSQVGDLSSSEDFNRYHTCPFCDFKTETAVGMAGHYRQSHADLLERAHKRPQNDEEPSTSQLSPMKQCAKCSYESRSFESLLAHVENEHGTKKE